MTAMSLKQAYELALQHYGAGRLSDARTLFMQILDRQPEHPETLHWLGLVNRSMGRTDEAIELIRRSLAVKPNQPDALTNLGVTLLDKGSVDEAADCYRRAISLAPEFINAHLNLGIALNRKASFEEAANCFKRCIALNPSHAEAHYNLGIVLNRVERIDQAADSFRRAVTIDPDHFQAWNSLGVVLKLKAMHDEAAAAYRRAILIQPGFADAHFNLGNHLFESGLPGEAVAFYQTAVANKPNFVEAQTGLANAFRQQGQLDKAVTVFKEAIEANPRAAEVFCNLSLTFTEMGLLDQALEAMQKAIEIDPGCAEYQNNLGSIVAEMGDLDRALDAFRTAIKLNPHFTRAHSNLVYMLQCHPQASAQSILQQARQWALCHEHPLTSRHQAHSNDRDETRQLRIGYVSADFRNHVVALNLLPLFKHHDHRSYHLTCYAHEVRTDSITKQFRTLVDSWRTITDRSDAEVARQIREDRIDILIDLGLHTPNNRLGVFAHKPAPVQAAFAGYPGTTGLASIDYRLSDPHIDPPNMDESVYSERTIRLPHSFWCFDPLDKDIPVGPLPALQKHFVTFGWLNNFCKLNDQVLSLWAQVLTRVERSRLILLAKDGSHRKRTADRLAAVGIDPSRIEFVSPRPRREYFKLYHRLDIGLDSFPYNGHSTSLDSLWMGVPVITLVGPRVVARAGFGHLTNLNLTELAAKDPQDFVRIAVSLAEDAPRLQQLRSELRQRMEQSPLMDSAGFARGIEAAYRQMWIAWCRK